MGLLILIAIIVADALWAVSVYNSLVRRRNVVAEAWSGIDAQLKRRADLIPNLVETVKGYAGHERETFEDLARLRSQGQAQTDVAQRAQTETAITAAIGRVMAVGGAHPPLRPRQDLPALPKEPFGNRGQNPPAPRP